MTSTSFKYAAKGTGALAGYYTWGLAANWTNGAPFSGYDVVDTAVSPSNPQADDIASLTLNSLTLAATGTSTTELDVLGSLTLGSLSFSNIAGHNFVLLIANAAITGSSATITVNGSISVNGGTPTLIAEGAGASVFVNAQDPGNIDYWSEGSNGGSGGLVYLRYAPAASSTFFFDGDGIFAFANPSLTISASLTNVNADDSIELPADQVYSVTYGANSIAISTDMGVYNFTNVSFTGGTLNDFSTTADFATGLEKITFVSPSIFKPNAADTSGPYNEFYRWDNGANWDNGLIETNGGDVALAPVSTGLFLDDLSLATFNKLIFTAPYQDLNVVGRLTLDELQIGGTESDQTQALIASTQFTGVTSATITINNIVSVGGIAGDIIEAIGSGASAVVNSNVDPGLNYEASDDGKLIFNTAPTNPNSIISALRGATVIFAAPGTPVNGVTTISPAMSIYSGSSVELPGSTLLSSTSGGAGKSETIITDFGSYLFTDWRGSFDTGAGYAINDFLQSRDSGTFGLKLTGEAAGAADNPQHNHDVNSDGFADIIFQNISGQTAVWDMDGSDIASSSFLPNPGGTWALLGAGDFNGDGRADFLFQDAAGEIAEWRMNGNSIAAGLYLPDPGPAWKIDATGDFNGDGKSDIALQNSDGTVAIWELNGGNIIANGASLLANPGTAWKPVASGDFWGDGKTELVLQNTNGSLAFWGFNDSASGPVLDMSHTAALSLNPGAAWKVVGTGDFNGDTISDLVFHNSNTGQVAIWEMNKTGLRNSTSFTTLSDPGANLTVAQIGDFDGDGISDILFQATTSGGALGVDFMTSNLTVASLQILTNPGAAWHAIG